MSDLVLRYEILRLLRLHGEMSGRTLPGLKELAAVTRKRERDVRQVCSVLEAMDYIRGHHTADGDEDPAYEITIEGLVMLHKREYEFGASFIDEAMKGARTASSADRTGGSSARTGDAAAESRRTGQGD